MSSTDIGGSGLAPPFGVWADARVDGISASPAYVGETVGVASIARTSGIAAGSYTITLQSNYGLIEEECSHLFQAYTPGIVGCAVDWLTRTTIRVDVYDRFGAIADALFSFGLVKIG